MERLKEEFVARMRRDLLGDADALIDALAHTKPSVSVRLNSLKSSAFALPTEPVPWCKEGGYLAERPLFTFDPLLHAGCYYVQDASSMFITHVIRQIAEQAEPLAYLDLCAAPGGKTTAAINALPSGSLVVANEIDGRRAQILRENVQKWGSANCVVTNSDARQLGRLRSSFDIIAADMPCSGEGMMRKDEEAVAQWSETLVAECAARQKEIATDIWDALRPGGFFIYSTCTFNRSEDEDVADYIADTLGGEAIDIRIEKDWGIAECFTGKSHGYRFMPHRTRGEGLFMAVFRKAEGETSQHKKKKTNKGADKGRQKIGGDCLGWLTDSADYDLMQDGDSISALSKHYAPLMRQIVGTVRTLQVGLPLAEVKGRAITPHHAAALSTVLRPDAFPYVELTYTDALAYLRGESLQLKDAPLGYVVVGYKGYRLGFMKSLGNRANNCYPKEWRIRNQSVPAAPVSVVKT